MSLLYWTLHDDDEGAVVRLNDRLIKMCPTAHMPLQIYLALDTGESNQIWAVVSPDAD